VADPFVMEPAGEPDLDALELEQLGDVADVGELVGQVPDVERTRRFLAGMTGVLAVVLADPDVDGHWELTPLELEGLAHALTSIAARTPQLADAIDRSDYLMVAGYLGMYTTRNVKAGRNARAARKERDGLEGEAADGGGPRFADRGSVGPSTPAGGNGVGGAGWVPGRS
jgi:hypothetical protein